MAEITKQTFIDRASEFLKEHLAAFELGKAEETVNTYGILISKTKFKYQDKDGNERTGLLKLYLDTNVEELGVNSRVDIIFDTGAHRTPRSVTLSRTCSRNGGYKKPQLDRLNIILKTVEGSYFQLEKEEDAAETFEKKKAHFSKVGLHLEKSGTINFDVLEKAATAETQGNKLTITLNDIEDKLMAKVLSTLQGL